MFNVCVAMSDGMANGSFNVYVGMSNEMADQAFEEFNLANAIHVYDDCTVFEFYNVGWNNDSSFERAIKEFLFIHDDDSWWIVVDNLDERNNITVDESINYEGLSHEPYLKVMW